MIYAALASVSGAASSPVGLRVSVSVVPPRKSDAIKHERCVITIVLNRLKGNGKQILFTPFKKKKYSKLYFDRLVTFAGKVGQCVHLPHGRIVIDGSRVTTRFGAVTYVHRVLAVVQDRCRT